jgi:hypothetical protein
LVYLLTAVGLTPSGSGTVHIYTQTIHRTTQLTTLVGRLSGIRTQSGQTKINLGGVRAVPRVCELYPGICLTTEEKVRKNLSQGSRRMPVGTTKKNLAAGVLWSMNTQALCCFVHFLGPCQTFKVCSLLLYVTPCSRVLEKLIVPHQVKKVHEFTEAKYS